MENFNLLCRIHLLLLLYKITYIIIRMQKNNILIKFNVNFFIF